MAGRKCSSPSVAMGFACSGTLVQVTNAVFPSLASSSQLDRLANWRERAGEGTADLSGKTPGTLISALIRTPVLSAQMAETLTGASRAAVQRNLSLLAKRRLVLEITGQARYRFWRVV